ncbi:hypothetical protein BH20ACT24_BH20ACT24_05300 [soil metagenome]|nr:M15 family metallopeptidase [Actinomycetota bacterium]
MSLTGLPGRARRLPFVWIMGGLLLALAGLLLLRSAVDGGFGASSETPGATTSISPPPASTRTPEPAASLVAPPPCSFEDRPTARSAYEDWAVTLLDTTFRLDREYAPPDLAAAELAGFASGFLVRELLVEDLASLRAAAERSGNPVALIAAYRTYEEQSQLFELREAQLGHEVALRRVARPGHSEHQLGTAVDFKTPGAADVTAAWASTPQGRWMEANAHRFGFVESYPSGQEALTCYAYEPWHYRYVGREFASAVQASGLTLREYLWHWQETGSPP